MKISKLLKFGVSSHCTIGMGLFTFAELMTAGIQQTFVLKIAPEHMQGQYFAAASLRYTIGRTIAPIAIPMSLWFGYTITFAILAASAVLSGVLYYVMFQKVERKKHDHVEAS